MSYFRNTPNALYRFGNNEKSILFQDISRYADTIDAIKDDVTAYTKYTILENMRPDQVSFELYGNPQYYWTFFLMNDNIREQGWPLSQTELLTQCQRDFPGTVLVTSTNLVQDLFTGTGVLRDKILSGVTLIGQTSGVIAEVDHIHYDLGLIVVKGTKSFLAGEFVYLSTDINVGFTASSVVAEYLSTHHWEDANGNYVDLIGDDGIVDITGGALNTEITNYDNYIRVNDSLKEIKVLKRGIVGQVSDAIKTAINS